MMVARKLFAENGYDATTLRQVAERAGLGLGTLFNYISDKRDLIYLVFNKDVSVVTDVSLAAPRPWQSFNENILAMMEPNYRLFGSEPVLSRILLSEVLQHTPGFHLAEHLSIRGRLIGGITEVVAAAQKTGEIGSPESPELIARHIFFLFGGHPLVAGCFGEPGLAIGDARLRLDFEPADYWIGATATAEEGCTSGECRWFCKRAGKIGPRFCEIAPKRAHCEGN